MEQAGLAFDTLWLVTPSDVMSVLPDDDDLWSELGLDDSDEIEEFSYEERRAFVYRAEQEAMQHVEESERDEESELSASAEESEECVSAEESFEESEECVSAEESLDEEEEALTDEVRSLLASLH